MATKSELSVVFLPGMTPSRRSSPDGAQMPDGQRDALSPMLRATRRLAVRTGSGPLRPFWAGMFETLILVLAAAFRHWFHGAAVYVRGSFASREPVYGLSDVDLILVVPDSLGSEARKHARERWEQLAGAAPALRRIAVLAVYRQTELADTARSSLLTYGLDCSGGGTVGDGAAPRSHALALRPGLYGATADWRRVAGPERRPPIAEPSGGARWAPAWLELQCWWRYAFWACREADVWACADLCVKLVAEPARIWLWIEHGVRCRHRLEALERALSLLPAEEEALRLALRLRRTLRDTRVPPLAETLAYLVRMSQRLADRLALDREAAGMTNVRLAWGKDDRGVPAEGEQLPFVDWRARVFPSRPDERFVVVPGAPSSSADLAEAASMDAEQGPRPALLAPSLLVLPTFDLETRPLIRGALRAVQCMDSDPVSFAVLAGELNAAFPNIAGLAAQDGALRAAASHRARLHDLPTSASSGSRFDLGMLMSAARAAVFSGSILDSDPELPLTIPAIVETYAAREPTARGPLETVAGEYLNGAEGADSAMAASALAARLAEDLARVARPDRMRTI